MLLFTKDSKSKIRIVSIEYEWSDDDHSYLIHRRSGLLGGKFVDHPDIKVSCGKAKRTLKEQVKLQYDAKIKEYKDKDVVAHDGIIINCYPNIDDMDYVNDEYTYKLEGNVISTFETRKNDSLVVQENNYERLIYGYDDNVYRIEAEFYEIHNKLYSAFPSYKIQCDGSIAVVEGSALENLKKLRAKQNKVKTR